MCHTCTLTASEISCSWQGTIQIYGSLYTPGTVNFGDISLILQDTSTYHALPSSHIRQCNEYTIVSPKKWPHFNFLNNSLKNKPIWIIFGIQILEETLHKCFWTCPPHLKNVATVPSEMHNSCIWWNLHFFLQKSGWLLNSQLFCHMETGFHDKENLKSVYRNHF